MCTYRDKRFDERYANIGKHSILKIQSRIKETSRPLTRNSTSHVPRLRAGNFRRSRTVKRLTAVYHELGCFNLRDSNTPRFTLATGGKSFSLVENPAFVSELARKFYLEPRKILRSSPPFDTSFRTKDKSFSVKPLPPLPNRRHKTPRIGFHRL